MLRRIIEAAVDLVDARYGALGVLDETGTRLAEFITVGIDDEHTAADRRTAQGSRHPRAAHRRRQAVATARPE